MRKTCKPVVLSDEEGVYGCQGRMFQNSSISGREVAVDDRKEVEGRGLKSAATELPQKIAANENRTVIIKDQSVKGLL